MATTGIARSRYFHRQFLRPEDFENEQAYHLAMRRRHNISEHTWGIVSGLTVQQDEGGALFLQPGFAIDGYGREIVLSQRRQLAAEEFDNQRSEVLDVWIRYGRQATDPAPKGYSGCGPASEPYRSPESPVVRFEKPDLSYPNRRQPKLVPPSDYDFSATRTPPDEPEALWPVFLGQVTRGGTVDARTFTINPADRPYAGLIGESVVGASGETRLQIGRGADPNDPPGFAVFIPAVAQRGEASLQIDDQNHITLRGNTEVAGDVAITKGALEFAITPGQPLGPPVVSPLPQPWKIYVAPNDQGGTDLCLEMARSTGVPNRVTMGTFSPDDKKYVPCLTVEEDCTVTVEKNLVVNGTITGPGGVVPDIVMQGFTKEAKDLLLSSLLTGVSGSAALLGQFFQPSVPTTAPMIAALLDSSATETATFATLVKTRYPDLANRLKGLLG